MSDPDAPGYWDMPHEQDAASPVREDTAALLAFATSIRGVAWSTQLGAALRAAEDAGWTWERRGKAALLLIFSPDGEPRSLTEATRDPVARTGAPSVPNDDWRQARQELERKRAAS